MDVLVLGAGMAGLSSARALADAGKRVVVLEARDRVGGRIATLHDAALGMPLELGAEFVHGKHPAFWRVLKAAGAQPKDCDGEHLQLRKRRLSRSDGQFEEAMELMAQMGDREETALAFLRRRGVLGTPLGALAYMFVQGFYAADVNRISARAIRAMAEGSDEVGGERMWRPTAGYDTAPLYLARGLDVRLSTRVEQVRWRRGHVEATAVDALGRRERFTARAAVVALQLGHSVRFAPRLSRHERAARTLELGAIVKVLIRFRDPFWEHTRAGGDFAFLHSSETAVTTWWRPLPFDAPVLVGWTGGPAARALSHKKPEDVLDVALDSLAKFFAVPKAKLSPQVDAFRVADWQADPLTRGGYMVVPAGAVPAVGVLAESVERTLYFAGEHTCLAHAGTVHGAYVSGQRAAKELLHAS